MTSMDLDRQVRENAASSTAAHDAGPQPGPEPARQPALDAPPHETAVPRLIALRDHLVVEGSVRGCSVALDALVVRVGDVDLWLGMPEPDAIVSYFHSGQPLRLVVPTDGGAMLGESAYLKRLAGDPPRVFAVERPVELVAVQRRVHHRFDLETPVRFRRLDPITKEARGSAAPASAVNVSLGGMLLRTAAHVAVGDEVEMTLPVGGDDRIATTNRVVRVRALPTPNVPGQPFVLEVGTRFTRITAADQDMLVRMAIAADRRRRLAAEATAAVVDLA
jgi:c-di-GMP-binding flagellar brake protein YcgR